MFKNPFSFDGRIRRTEFGISFIIYLVLYVVQITAIEAAGGGGAIFGLLMIIPMVWFLWAQGAKRCHDIGKSGWWQLIPFFFLWLLFQESDPGRNEYGHNPKGIAGPTNQYDVSSETLDGHLRT